MLPLSRITAATVSLFVPRSSGLPEMVVTPLVVRARRVVLDDCTRLPMAMFPDEAPRVRAKFDALVICVKVVSALLLTVRVRVAA